MGGAEKRDGKTVGIGVLKANADSRTKGRRKFEQKEAKEAKEAKETRTYKTAEHLPNSRRIEDCRSCPVANPLFPLLPSVQIFFVAFCSRVRVVPGSDGASPYQERAESFEFS